MTSLDSRAQRKLREAAEWRLIGLLFECPRPGWRRQVEQVAREVEDGSLRDAAALAATEASEGLYHSTFGPGGPAPPREATHRDTLQLGYLMSELQAFYDSFGYKADAGQPPDHICVETGFVSYLHMKQAYAFACADETAAQVAGEACREFVTEHVASVADPMQSMLANSGVAYLDAAARALALRTGPAKTRFLIVGAGGGAGAGSDDNPYGCGDAPQADGEELLL